MMDSVLNILGFFAYALIFIIGLGLATVAIMFVIDTNQNADAIRRNYPVIGRFRDWFSELGEFFRQYFFAMDREEMPFNRAEREWIKRATDDDGSTVAFGSTKNLDPVGSTIFVNGAFAKLEKDTAPTAPLVIGPFCAKPYSAPSFFNVSAMSYGSISKPAIKALSSGAKMGGFWLNTGEGGLSPYHLEGGCDIVFQMGTAKYGARNDDGSLNEVKLREIAAHEQVRMIEIKLSQGAKPGKGGILPGHKVTQDIAEVRGIAAGEDSISPNRHPEIGNVEELLDFIARVREISGKPVGIKAVVGAWQWLEDLCEAIHKRGIEHAPDFFTLDGGDGGTGAAPMPLMDNVGLQLDESLPLLSDVLHKYNLRERIRIIASGKRVTPADAAWALCAGADFINSARGFMFSLGCIQAMRCNMNTCPTGITTQDERLQKGLDPAEKKYRVANYHRNLVHEVEVIAHSCGVEEPRGLRRHHVRIVQDDGRSVPLDKLFPRPEILRKYDEKPTLQ